MSLDFCCDIQMVESEFAISLIFDQFSIVLDFI